MPRLLSVVASVPNTLRVVCAWLSWRGSHSAGSLWKERLRSAFGPRKPPIYVSALFRAILGCFCQEPHEAFPTPFPPSSHPGSSSRFPALIPGSFWRREAWASIKKSRNLAKGERLLQPKNSRKSGPFNRPFAPPRRGQGSRRGGFSGFDAPKSDQGFPVAGASAGGDIGLGSGSGKTGGRTQYLGS